MSSLIEAVDVRRAFRMGPRTLEVLRGVSLAIAEGESLAITGMSGAGKSTLLHALGGLDRPTSGQVLYRARDPARNVQLRRDCLARLANLMGG